MDLLAAKLIADSIHATVKPHVKRVEIAGSIRREKSSVKDVELVILEPDYEQMYAALAQHGRFIKPGVPDIIDWPPKANAKYVRMLLNGDIKLDIFVANEDNWGSLLCMRTGSAADEKGNVFNGFITGMFSTWKKISGGGKMVKCQPTMPDGLMLACPEEKDFFELCNVEWVEPSLRINRKAIKKLGKKENDK